MSEVVCIKTFPYRHEAELARSALESYGIKAVVTTDDCGGQDPVLGLVSGGVGLLVLHERAAEALEILEREDD
jgi:hypothetical protein